MTEFIKRTREQLILNWMMVFYFGLFTFSALASCTMASLIGADWETMSSQGKFMIILAVFSNWATVMMAFLNKAVSRVQAGQLPISPEDQQLITKDK